MKLQGPSLAVLAATWSCAQAIGTYQVTSPRVEYMPCPALGIDVPAPRFGWVVEPVATPTTNNEVDEDDVRGAYQQAFQIVVTAADSSQPTPLWDSGRVESSESRHVAFGSVGQPPAAALRSATAYDWTVTVWVATEEGNPAAAATTATAYTSETPARFITGMLDATEDWAGAEWLVAAEATANLCRSCFAVKDSQVQRAVLVVAGLGYFQATLNGQRVTDAELESGWTDYAHRVPYSTYDVTALVHGGGAANVLGMALGNGWYTTNNGAFPNGGGEPTDVPRTFIAKLWVNGKEVLTTTAAGATEGLGTKKRTAAGQWRCAPGPILYDSVYNGEVFDAKVARQMAGWTGVSFQEDGRYWKPAVVSAKPPAGVLVSPMMPPVRKVAELEALSITEPKKGVFVVDFGQNFAGRVSLSLPRKGTAGNVTLRHAEVLQHDGIVPTPEAGMIYVDNLRSARATDVYVFDSAATAHFNGGGGKEGEEDMVVFEPTFTYHGFRYVEITGYEPRLSEVKGVVLHTDVDFVGSVTFSDPLLNKIQSAIHWGQRSNLMSVPTDCPQRDERKGWLGDAQLSGEEALFNFDVVAMLLKFLHDIVDTQNEAGQIADTAPFTFGGRPADPSWGSAFPSLVYFLYKETGDLRIVRDFHPYLVKYVDSVILAAESTGLANLYKSYGDWCPLPGAGMCSPHLTGSFSFLENVKQMQELTAALGPDYAGDALVYGAYHHSFSRAFHLSFYHDNTYDIGVQTCLALPLWADAVPADLRDGILDKLLMDLVETHQYHATTGIIGLKYMLEVLSQTGKTDVAVRMLQQRDYPSFGWMVTNPREPATTIWELWNADVSGPNMNSRNHVMFGGPVGGFFYKFLGGVRPGEATPEAAGYKEVVFAPPLAACMPLEQASTSVRTLQGEVGLEWRQGPGDAPPVNGTTTASSRHLAASVRVPLGSKGRVVLDGRALGAGSPTLAVQVDGVALSEVGALKGLEVLQASDKLVELRLVSGTWVLDVRFDVDAETALRCSNEAAGGMATTDFAAAEVEGVTASA